MSSQKSTPVAAALEPKRHRGRLRVAAILEAGGEVFAEKGYDAATMTEIAAKAQTAIGSLYRFFPTKEVLADALLTRYGTRLEETMDGIAARAAILSPAALADALIDGLLAMRPERTAAAALLETLRDGPDKRSQVRRLTRQRVAAILQIAAQGRLPSAQVAAQAAALTQVMKAAMALAEEEERTGQSGLVEEARRLGRLYLGDILKSD